MTQKKIICKGGPFNGKKIPYPCPQFCQFPLIDQYGQISACSYEMITRNYIVGYGRIKRKQELIYMKPKPSPI